MHIIDTHAHLDHVEDVDGALQRAREADVSDVVAMGVELKANARNLELKKAATSPRVHVALGIHPGNINNDERKESFRFIREHIREAVAVGETGLDYWYKWVRKNDDEKARQRDYFEEHLRIAKEFDLPVVIHSRGAWKVCLEMTKAAGVAKANFHWYSGPVDVLKEILDAGYFVSCSPSLGYSPQSREAISFAPLERTMIETDSPVFYKFSEEDPGFKAEPKDVWRTLKAYCALKNLDEDKALEILNNNARQFFGLK